VFSIYGQKLYGCELLEEDTIIDVSDFQNGVHFVRLYADSGMQTYKFIKK
jgi:hypothetical protein